MSSAPEIGEALVKLADAASQLSERHPFKAFFKHDGEIEIELYAPVGVDRQSPHERDEVYIIASGSGAFRRGDETFPFSAGDLLFVPAHMPHRFETFTADFKTWVIFFGAPRATQ
jgi:mannose-6-phosphate isomerase-like protein (cupin superfamily)